MTIQTLVAIVDEEPGPGGVLVRSPAVGLVSAAPRAGVFLSPLEPFLALSILGRRHPLLLPRGVQGWVSEPLLEGRQLAVEYRQPLFRLRAGLEPGAEGPAAGTTARGTATDGDLIAVTAPSDGIFYRRPKPDTPAYVEEGAPVSRGTVLGLVEVMKSFNQIVYGGPGLPERGTVARIEVQDTVEVRFGQTLFLIQPGD